MQEVIYPFLARIPDAVYFGYIVFCVCILPLHYLKKELPLRKYLVVANTLLASVSLLYFIYRIILFQVGSMESGEFEEFAFNNRVFGPYWFTYWAPVIAPLIFQLLWIRRIRYSYTAVIFFALVAVVPCFLEEIVMWITAHFRDFLPSNWTIYTPEYIWGRLFQILTFLYLFGITYLLLRKRLKSVG
jgi:molybdopterin-containing oxidoreductase family membrane subunit